jgi:anti-sigma B factor antagonist
VTTVSPRVAADLLTVDTVPGDGTVRIVCAGEVDCSTAPALRRALDDAFTGRVRVVTVDLEAVTFLDSAGLSVLAVAHRTAVRAGARLRVLVGTRAVTRALQVTGLYDLLGVEQVTPGAGVA